MRRATLDLGSNTFLCLISEAEAEGPIKILSDQAEVVRLGQGVAQTRRFHPEALVRARACLERFAVEIKNWGVTEVKAFATAAARKAENKNELEDILSELEIPFQIISGDEEALMTFQGAISGLPSLGPWIVIDIGGGSTEITVGDRKGIRYRHSFEIGVVRLREQYVSSFPISQNEIENIEKDIELTFMRLPAQGINQEFFEIVAVAGTPTTLAAAALGGFDSEKVDGFQFSDEDLLHWEAVLKKMTPKEIEEKYKVPSGRSDVLLVGVMILKACLSRLGRTSLRTSVRGLRFGAVYRLNQLKKEQEK